jgi:acyl-CoA synthetase (AMP-forming)/AMP-acid ligase II
MIWKTGGFDVARMDDGGYFIIVGRNKDQINTAGFKVWPREVEEVIYGHPAVKLVAVIGVDDAYRGEVVKAYVALKEGPQQRLSAEELLSFCKERLTHPSQSTVPAIGRPRAVLPQGGRDALSCKAL